MSKNIFSYFCLLVIAMVSLASCSDDLVGRESAGSGKEIKGTLVLNLSTPDLAVRTRTLNVESGASVRINNLWVGVFSTATGECFGAKRYDDMNRVLQSGVVFNKMLAVDFVAPGAGTPLAYIIAVANYDGVTTYDGRPLAGILPDFDDRASVSWDTMISLGIDTASAYAGKKGEDDDSNAPFLAGFFQDAVSLSQSPKIDQFAYPELGPAALYPEAAASGMDIMLGDGDDTYVAAGALCLRRLVAHNNIKISTANGFEVMSVSYRRHNMPRSVFMLPRRVDESRYSDFYSWRKNSPNFADRLLSDGNYDISDDAFPYASDSDWTLVDASAREDSEHVSFAFDHFENLHWGSPSLSSQEDREKLNPDGTFAALCNGPQDRWNNFASYFELRLHIINPSTGESADVEYRLHEGFCNTPDGRRASSLQEKCRDFSSFRNVNYTYNINIAGVNDIKASVTGVDGQEAVHPEGQSGYIWKMNFATGEAKQSIPIEGGEFDFGGNYLSFGDNPDLGFRLIGTDSDGEQVDICYNMPEEMYNGFAGLWSTTERPVVAGSLSSAAAAAPQKLLSDLLVGNASGFYNVVDFVRAVSEGRLSPAGRYSFRFPDYAGDSEGLKGNYPRGLYIFDRNDARNATDADGCSALRVAYGGEQFPFVMEKIEFDPKNIVWDNVYYKKTSWAANVFATANAIFYGAESSSIDLRWKHDERFIGYRISVYNASYTHPAITVDRNSLDSYLQDYDGGKLFVYPLSTAAFPHSPSTGAINYNFTITPIVDTGRYYECDPVDITWDMDGTSTTSIRVCPSAWEISATNDWKEVTVGGLSGGVDMHYRGLGLVISREKTVEEKYNAKGKYICFGAGGNSTTGYFSFVASVPGKISVIVNSHSGKDDAARQLIIARMNENGSITNDNGERYDEVYKSGAMAGSKTTYTSPVLTPCNNRPTEFRIYCAGSTDYYKITFTPSN